MIVGEQESIGAGAQNAAGTPFHLAVIEKTVDEVLWLTTSGGESNDAITCADLRMAGAVECNQKCIGSAKFDASKYS